MISFVRAELLKRNCEEAYELVDVFCSYKLSLEILFLGPLQREVHFCTCSIAHAYLEPFAGNVEGEAEAHNGQAIYSQVTRHFQITDSITHKDGNFREQTRGFL